MMKKPKIDSAENVPVPSAAAIEEYDAWLVWLKQSQERAEGQIESMMRSLRALRDKMWYVTDVRNSAPYEDSRNIAVALKTMGAPHRWEALQRANAPRGLWILPSALHRHRVDPLPLQARTLKVAMSPVLSAATAARMSFASMRLSSD